MDSKWEYRITEEEICDQEMLWPVQGLETRNVVTGLQKQGRYHMGGSLVFSSVSYTLSFAVCYWPLLMKGCWCHWTPTFLPVSLSLYSGLQKDIRWKELASLCTLTLSAIEYSRLTLKKTRSHQPQKVTNSIEGIFLFHLARWKNKTS